jgi:hypothetical protein
MLAFDRERWGIIRSNMKKSASLGTCAVKLRNHQTASDDSPTEIR